MNRRAHPGKRDLFLTCLEDVLKILKQTPPVFLGKQPGKNQIDAITAGMQSADLWLRSLEPYNPADFPEISPETTTFNDLAEERKGNKPFDCKKRDDALTVLNKIATMFEDILTTRRKARNTRLLRSNIP